MSAMTARCMTLLLCAVLAAGEAGAAGRASDARESTTRKAAPSSKADSEDRRQDLEAWLARLNGSFKIRLEIPPETKCGALNSSVPNSTQVCTTTKAATYVSAVNCRGVGQGPGLYCTFDELRREPSDRDAGKPGAPASLFSNELPSRMLMGIDPVVQKIRLMVLDPGGPGYSAMASPVGNALNFKGKCDLAEAKSSSSCTWNLSMRASTDGHTIVMTRSNSRGNLGTMNLNAPHTFELTKQE